uniref:OmpA-like domain-containing protein n=1 Tax=Phaselicystis flava TaxID=525924 RepID=A0A3S5GYH3_9BACT|nr:hypothetical protein [Phaselicystis flava]
MRSFTQAGDRCNVAAVRARIRSWTAVSLTALVLGASSASAADPPPVTQGIRVDRMQPASPDSAFFRAEGPHTPVIGGAEIAAGLTLEYGMNVLRQVGVDEAGKEQALATLIDQAVFARVSASVIPVHWLSFDVSIPFALLESGPKAPQPWGLTRALPKPDAPAIGDPRFGVHFRPVDTTAFGLILGGRVWAPVGSQDAYLSDKQVRAEVDLGVAGDASRLLYGCTFNVAPGFFVQRSGDRVAAACALHVKATSFLSIGVEPTVDVTTQSILRPASGSGAAAGGLVEESQYGLLVEPMGAVRLRFGGFRLGLAAGPGFGGSPGTAQLRTLFNVGWVGSATAPKAGPGGPTDRDLDTILDADDACPDEAGPENKNRAQNGCPARDRDGDGIRDSEDFCPERAGILYPDPNATGCPDSDNDGLPDPIDTCKTEPGVSPGGCPRFARLGSAGFTVQPPIAFDGEDRLTADARGAIEEIAATMRANPKIEQVSFGVGTKGGSTKSSDKQAQEILLVLRAGNLDSSRYEVVFRDDVRAGTVVVRLVR